MTPERLEKRRAAGRKWRRAHPDRQRESNLAYYAAHRVELVSDMRARDEALRRAVITGYGGQCVCCGETNWRFLALDHVNDDGAEMRRNGPKSGAVFNRWLINQNFPNFIQLLCHNCNVAKALYGFCPHGNCWRSMIVGA